MSSEMTATQKALFDVLNECYDLPYDRFIEIFPDLEKLVGPESPGDQAGPTRTENHENWRN